MTDDDLKIRIEQAIAELSDAEFDNLVARTRPPKLESADWRESLAAKTQQLAQLISNADQNGHPRK